MNASEVLDVTLLSLRVSLVATLGILVPGVALGYVFARLRFPGRALLKALVSLPMVLPPVATGFLLLVLLSRRSLAGAWLEELLGRNLVLTWWAAAIASAVMSFPLLVLGAEQGFASVPRRIEQVAATLGASPARVFLRVTMPLAARGILYGAVFAFARGLGEFGATTIVAGNLSGRTATLSIAIYDRIESYREAEAVLLSLVSLLVAFAITAAAEVFLRGRATR